MNQRRALMSAGIVFQLILFANLIRLIVGTQVIIGGHIIPMWASLVAFFIAWGLSVWMFLAARTQLT